MEALLKKIWSRPHTRYAFVFCMTLFADFWMTYYFHLVAISAFCPAAAIAFCIPFMNLAFNIWFIESKSLSERLKLTLSSALGYGIANLLMIIVV